MIVSILIFKKKNPSFYGIVVKLCKDIKNNIFGQPLPNFFVFWKMFYLFADYCLKCTYFVFYSYLSEFKDKKPYASI